MDWLAAPVGRILGCACVRARFVPTLSTPAISRPPFEVRAPLSRRVPAYLEIACTSRFVVFLLPFFAASRFCEPNCMIIKFDLEMDWSRLARKRKEGRRERGGKRRSAPFCRIDWNKFPPKASARRRRRRLLRAISARGNT